MVDVVRQILGESASQSYVQFTACICTVICVVILGRCICRMFDI